MLRRIDLIVSEGDADVTFTTFCGHSQHVTIRALLECAISNCPNPRWIDAVEDGKMYAADHPITAASLMFDKHTIFIDPDGSAEHVFYCFWLRHEVHTAEQ